MEWNVFNVKTRQTVRGYHLLTTELTQALSRLRGDTCQMRARTCRMRVDTCWICVDTCWMRAGSCWMHAGTSRMRAVTCLILCETFRTFRENSC